MAEHPEPAPATSVTDPVITMLESEWASISALAHSLDATDWLLPTDCPGWSVQDQLSHLSATEGQLLGRETPEHNPPDTTHAKNPMGVANEKVVDYRRSWPPDQVLAEFDEATRSRVLALRAMTAADLDAESWTPTGPGRYRDLLAIRLFDAWTHEQDIRRATGRPGHLAGPVARHCLDRCAMAMGFVVGKKAGAPEGSAVVFDIGEPTPAVLAIEVKGGRAQTLSDVPEDPTVRLRMGFETFACLGLGRSDPVQVLASDQVTFDGDEDLGRRIVENMAFMI
ncbi:MAG: maleylpyruvate isomerase family mycothiol-dependent enzyme [Acidimicrobiales bacterium]